MTDSDGKSKGSREFIEIHEDAEDEVSPLPKSENWSNWKQVGKWCHPLFKWIFFGLNRFVCRLARPEKVKQVKAKSTAETILKRTSLTVILCQQVEKTYWMRALHQEEEGRG